MQRNRAAFTLVELMVSTAILTLMMVILLQMTNQTANTWRYGAAKAEQFSEARKAFETMTRRVAEATLNTYWDYYFDKDNTNVNPDLLADPFTKNLIPTSYARFSDLRFRVVQMSDPQYDTPSVFRPTHGVFFQAPVGMVEASDTTLHKLDELINSWGYFVEVAQTTKVPKFLASSFPTKTRSRLMEFRQPSEEFDLYRRVTEKIKADIKAGRLPDRDPDLDAAGKVSDPKEDDWFKVPVKQTATTANRPVRVLAENIIALVILPRLTPLDERLRKEAAKDPTSGVNKNRLQLTPNYEYHSKQLSNYAGTPGFSYATEKKRLDAEINPRNQLPPVLQVVMVAIDENSSQRLAEANATTGDLGLKTLLKDTSGTGNLFTDSALLEAKNGDEKQGDLAKLEEQLIAAHVSYRIFSSNVAIRGAKWSRAQAR